jgi:predicted DNA-binding protein with PD1-like motif
MRSKLINDGAEKTIAVIFDSGDEAMEGLLSVAKEQGLSASHFTAIGAMQSVTLGYFDWEKKDYRKIEVREQVEVLSLIGDIATHEGKPKVHAHLVVGKSDGTTMGGHLLSGIVRPTLEVVITESPRHLRRKHDPETGLALIDLTQ